MKKRIVIICQISGVLILLIAAILLLNRQSSKNPNNPAVYGSPYTGGPGQGYASGEYAGRADGSDAKR